MSLKLSFRSSILNSIIQFNPYKQVNFNRVKFNLIIN